MDRRIRVLIADDQRSARNGLKALINVYPEFEVIGMASNGLEAVQMANEYQPDVILMDMQMPIMDGPEATRLVKDRWPTIKVIALALYVGRKDEAFAAGVDAHLLKGFEAGNLHKIILKTMHSSIGKSFGTEGINGQQKSRSTLRQE